MLLPLLLCHALLLSAAPIEVQAVIRSMGTREPVVGASVLMTGSLGNEQEFVSDGQGRVVLPLSEGEWDFRIVGAGFLPLEIHETITPESPREWGWSLEPEQLEPYETTVSGARQQSEATRFGLDKDELRSVPGTMGDPFRAVMALPGVASVMSGVAYPVVRGASPASTGYFLDGIRVPMLYHLFLGPSVINPDFIDRLDFIPGAAPAPYGRLLGGVIDGKTRAPSEQARYSVSIDLLSTGAFAAIPIPSTGTDVTLAGRFSYTPWVLALASAASRALELSSSGHSSFAMDFWDYQARIEQRLGPGKLRLFAFGSSDHVGLEAEGADGFGAINEVRFHRVDLRYRWPVAALDVEVGATVGLDRIGFVGTQAGSGATTIGVDETSLSGRFKIETRSLKGLRIEAGGDVEQKRSTLGLDGLGNLLDPSLPNFDLPEMTTVDAGLYLQATFGDGDDWLIAPGVRFDTYQLRPDYLFFAVDPRLTFRKRLTDGIVLKGGAGLFHQPPTMLFQLPVLDAVGLRYGLQEGAQFDLGVEVGLLPGFTLSIDSYYNPLIRTVEFNPLDTDRLAFNPAFQAAKAGGRSPSFDDVLAGLSQIASGRAYGVEILLRRALGGNWFGWLGYSYQRSLRHETITPFDGNGGPLPQQQLWMPYAFDESHVLNAVVSRRLGRWTLGLGAHFNTGRPESGVMTSQTLVRGTNTAGDPDWLRVSANTYDRLPPYFRFDLRVARSFLFEDFWMEASLDIMNVTFTREIVAYDYEGGTIAPGGLPFSKTPQGIPVVLPILALKANY